MVYYVSQISISCPELGLAGHPMRRFPKSVIQQVNLVLGKPAVQIGNGFYPRTFYNTENFDFLKGRTGPWAELPIGVESMYALAERIPDCIRAIFNPATGEILGVVYHPGTDWSGFVVANQYPGWYFDGQGYEWISVDNENGQRVYITDDPPALRPNISRLYYLS